jgi:hypothetical protein
MVLLPGLVPKPHSYVEPMPAVPPVAVSVVLAPLQIDVVPEMPVGAVDVVLTLTVKVTAAEVTAQGAVSTILTQ